MREAEAKGAKVELAAKGWDLASAYQQDPLSDAAFELGSYLVVFNPHVGKPESPSKAVGFRLHQFPFQQCKGWRLQQEIWSSPAPLEELCSRFRRARVCLWKISSPIIGKTKSCKPRHALPLFQRK